MPSTAQQPRIFITGLGLVTPLGHSAWATFRALLDGRGIADRCRKLDADISPVDLVRAVGGVSFAQLSSTDPAVDIAARAIGEALQQSGTDAQPMPALLGVSKGATHALLDAARMYHRSRHGRTANASRGGLVTPVVADAALAVAIGPHGYLAHHLHRRFDHLAVQPVVAACASSVTALHIARQRMCRPGGPKRMLVATVEASLSPMFIHSYRRLGVLPPLSPAGYRGQPLDQQRHGFMLSECAAAVVLQRVETNPAPDQAVELLDTAVASESNDLVRTSPDRDALRHVAGRLLRERSIDLLHPHATGTTDNDETELAALREYAPDADAYACKGAIGHGLGAAGLSAAVLAALCGRARQRPIMPWIDAPIPGVKLDSHRQLPGTSTHAIFAAGFGAHVAGAVLRCHG